MVGGTAHWELSGREVRVCVGNAANATITLSLLPPIYATLRSPAHTWPASRPRRCRRTASCPRGAGHRRRPCRREESAAGETKGLAQASHSQACTPRGISGINDVAMLHYLHNATNTSLTGRPERRSGTGSRCCGAERRDPAAICSPARPPPGPSSPPPPGTRETIPHPGLGTQTSEVDPATRL